MAKNWTNNLSIWSHWLFCAKIMHIKQNRDAWKEAFFCFEYYQWTHYFEKIYFYLFSYLQNLQFKDFRLIFLNITSIISLILLKPFLEATSIYFLIVLFTLLSSWSWKCGYWRESRSKQILSLFKLLCKIPSRNRFIT